MKSRFATCSTALACLMTTVAPVAAQTQGNTSVGGGPSVECRTDSPFRVTPQDMAYIPLGAKAIAIMGHLRINPTKEPPRYEIVDDGYYRVWVAPDPVIADDFEWRANELLGHRIEVIGCVEGPVQFPMESPIRFFSITELPEEKKDPEPREASIEKLLDNPDLFDGALVRVDGEFGGRGHRSLFPHTRVASSDWVLENEAGAIWIGGKDPSGEGFRLDPEDGADLGKGLRVVGRISYWKGMPRLRAERVVLLASPRDAERPFVIFTIPKTGSTLARGSQLELQFNREMAPQSFTGRVKLEYEGEPATELPHPEIRYDDEWWKLFITLPPDLEPDRWFELQLSDLIRDVEGRTLERDPALPNGIAVVFRFQSRSPLDTPHD